MVGKQITKNHSNVPIGTTDHRSPANWILQSCSQFVWLTLTSELHLRNMLPCILVLVLPSYTTETRRHGELVGRVPHVRDAPPCVHPKTSGGQRTAHPTKTVVLARATLEGNKSRVGRRRVGQANSPARSGLHKLWPTWKSSLQPNRKRCWSTAL